MTADAALQPERPAALVNLTYISDCLIPAETLESGLAELIAHAGAANRADQVTGALLVAGGRFVQTLEGDRTIIDRLMQRILQDPRHAVLRIIDIRNVPARSFGQWMAVYYGSSLFVSREVSRALARHGSPRDVDRLLRLVRELSAPLPPQQR